MDSSAPPTHKPRWCAKKRASVPGGPRTGRGARIVALFLSAFFPTAFPIGSASASPRASVHATETAERPADGVSWACDFEGTYCGMDEQSKIEPARRPALQEALTELTRFEADFERLSAEDAVGMIVNGFCKQVFNELPLEFAVEAHKLMNISLEGSVG